MTGPSSFVDCWRSTDNVWCEMKSRGCRQLTLPTRLQCFWLSKIGWCDRDPYNGGKSCNGKIYQFSKKSKHFFFHLIWKLVFHLKLIRLQLFSLSKDILKQLKKEFLKCSDYCLTSGGITPTKVHMGMPTLKLTNTVSPISLLYKKNRAKSSLKNWVDKQRFWNPAKSN